MARNGRIAIARSGGECTKFVYSLHQKLCTANGIGEDRGEPKHAAKHSYLERTISFGLEWLKFEWFE